MHLHVASFLYIFIYRLITNLSGEAYKGIFRKITAFERRTKLLKYRDQK